MNDSIETVIYAKDGVAVKWEQSGENRGFGNWQMSYELRGGGYVFNRYGDHLCPNFSAGKPVREAEVPEEVREILGHPTSKLLERFEGTCRFSELR